MINKGIPFLWDFTETEENADEPATGARLSAFTSFHDGNFTGAIVAGLVAGTRSLEGLCISGVLSTTGGNESSSGVGNAGGAVISGVASVVKGELDGISYGTLCNYARRNGRIAIQLGACNHISKYNDKGTVVQIGLYNRVGSQIIPLVNLKGIDNLFRGAK